MRFWPILADHAQALNGKLYVMGGGWNITGPAPSQFALAGILELDWDEANRPQRMQIQLLSEDGQPVMIPTPIGEQAVEIGGDLEVGRPPGTRAGTPFNLPIAINMVPIPIPPGGRYVWRFSFNGESRDEWRLPFSTRPAAPAPQAAPPAPPPAT